MHAKKLGTALAILAAALYALNAPFSKQLLHHAGPTMMAAFLYLGAGLGLLVMLLATRLMIRDTLDVSASNGETSAE